MQRTDMERFAFLYLCGSKDEAILTGKEKMAYSDFDRLTYLTDFFGFTSYNLEIWNQYVGLFSEQFEVLTQLISEDYPEELNFSGDDSIYRLHDMWIYDFCKNASTEDLQEWLTQYTKEIYEESGLEYNETESEG
ncbi:MULTISPECIES: hypothetical protein [Clostridia]|uniref:hypothetical protein n=1 Tax=Clostridia TaxID=186801 RepID=UPI00067EC5E8|nr:MULTISPECIES: hypothetical protein [Clostridia]